MTFYVNPLSEIEMLICQTTFHRKKHYVDVFLMVYIKSF